MSIPYGSNYNGTIGFSGTAPSISLLQNTEVTATIPGESTQKYVATFGFPLEAMVYVACNTTASVPSSGTVDMDSTGEPNPYQRFVKGGDVLSFITGDTSVYCGFSLRTIPG